MKKSTKAVMLGAVATVHAQSYTTSTFIECTPTAAGGTVTSYATMTSTVCDLCEHMSTTMVSGMPVHVTAYTTVYTNYCPTGLVPMTYTITESCTGMTPSFVGPSNTNAGYVPAGYTASMVDCGCDMATPGPIAMTFPISQGPSVPAPTPTAAPAAPVSSPAAGSSGSSPAAGSGSGGSSPAGAPAPNAAPAAASSSSPASYGESSPAGGSSPAQVSSPAGGSGSSPVASGASMPNSNAGGNSTITPFNPNSGSRSVAAGFLAIICAMAGGMIML